jgi:Ca2+-binding EF-hand superfamily protein
MMNNDNIEKDNTVVIEVMQKIPTRLEKMEQDIKGWSLLQEVFAQWDLDGNHTLTLSEVNRALTKYCVQQEHIVGITPEFIQSVFQEVDVNHDGTLDHREFSVFFAKFADAIDTSIHELALSMITILSDREDVIHDKRQQRHSSKLHYMPRLRKVLNMTNVTPYKIDDIEVYQLKEERDSLRKSVRELEVKLKQREAAIEHLEHAIQMQHCGTENWNSKSEIKDDNDSLNLQ